MPTAAKKTTTSTPRKRAAAADSTAEPEATVEENVEGLDKVATHDVIRPIVIAGSQHAVGDGVTLSGLDAAVLYNEGYVRRH